MTYYCTLELARAAGNMSTSTSVDSALLLQLIEVASARVDSLMRWPEGALLLTRAAVRIPITRFTRTASGEVLLPRVRRLVEYVSATLNGQPATLELIPADVPIAVRITGGCRGGELVVTGWWAAVRPWAPSQLRQAGVLSAALSASATTLPVAGLQAGQLVRVNDELMTVTAATAASATVRRGDRGTLASAHAAGDVARVWVIDEAVSWQVARQAAFLYSRRGAYETASADGIGSQQLPADLLAGLRGALDAYA